MQSEKNWDFNTSHVSINQRLHRDCEHQEAISIHLMFLLIGSGSLPKFLDANFNTSHVSINRVPSAITAFCFWKFNTSHVSINLAPTDANYRYTLEFQYISCFY